MNVNKIIANYEIKFFGGVPKVTRYWDCLKSNSIDILESLNVPQKGIQSCATIGLNSTDIGLTIEEKDLRVEILGAMDINVEYFKNMVASVAFEIMKAKKCFPGYIVENVIATYNLDTEMKHVLLTNPFLWKEVESILLDEYYLSWLMLVPISENEYTYAQVNGVDALENIFEEYQIDIYNINRASVI